MRTPEHSEDDGARIRRGIIRKASLLTVAFFAAGLATAIAGAALIALLLRFTGLPFLKTWGLISAVTIVVAFAGALWSGRRS